MAENKFKVGDYVRLVGTPVNRMGTLVSDPNSEGLFMFRYDIRLTDKITNSFVSEDQIEHYSCPTDDEARALNAQRKGGS